MTKLIEEGMINWHNDTKEDAEQKIKEYEAKKALDRKQKAEKEAIQKKAIEEAASDSPPFAKIIEVRKGSPADKGGLKVGDLIMMYGPVNYLNHHDLNSMIEVTRNNINLPLKIKVKRKGVEIDVTIVPGTWEGAGILGCRFDKL